MAVTVTFIGTDFKGAFTYHYLYSIVLVPMFQYCPSCGTKKIQYRGNRFHCPDCGFIYYHNTAAASGCVIRAGEKIVLLERGSEPALGKLDLPGGFVDPGEGILEGLVRELREELSWEPPFPPSKPLAEIFILFASFPNTYPYKNIVYNTCDLFFTVSVPGLVKEDLKSEPGEIAGIHFIRPEEINPGDLAFDSTRRAVQAFRKFILPNRTLPS
jgi:ADP-ribose pyrophosphatase YjhB (NUDIX family)